LTLFLFFSFLFFLFLFFFLHCIFAEPPSFLPILASSRAQRYFSSADDAQQKIEEITPLVETTDLGQDEESAEALIKKHNQQMEEIESYEFNISALRALSKVKLCSL